MCFLSLYIESSRNLNIWFEQMIKWLFRFTIVEGNIGEHELFQQQYNHWQYLKFLLYLLLLCPSSQTHPNCTVPFNFLSLQMDEMSFPLHLQRLHRRFLCPAQLLTLLLTGPTFFPGDSPLFHCEYHVVWVDQVSLHSRWVHGKNLANQIPLATWNLKGDFLMDNKTHMFISVNFDVKHLSFILPWHPGGNDHNIPSSQCLNSLDF